MTLTLSVTGDKRHVLEYLTAHKDGHLLTEEIIDDLAEEVMRSPDEARFSVSASIMVTWAVSSPGTGSSPGPGGNAQPKGS